MAGKAALACVTGGAVATVCVVAGVGPTLDLTREARSDRERVKARTSGDGQRRVRGIMPSQVGSTRTPPPAPPGAEPVTDPPGNNEPPPAEAPPPEPPDVPTDVPDFGLAPAAQATASPASSSGSESSRGSAAAQEFGP